MKVPRSFKKWSNSSVLRAVNGRRFFSENRGLGGINRMVSIQIIPNLDVESPDEVVSSLSDLQGQATKERVPWFQSVMPPSYFRQVPKDRRMRHLTSVAAVPDLEDIPEMVSKNYNSANELTSVSVISSGKKETGKFHSVLGKIPDSSEIQSVNLYTSSDGLLTITDISLNEHVTPESELPKELQKYVKQLQEGKFDTDRTQYLNNTGETLHATPGNIFEEKNLMDFIQNIQSPGFWNVSPRRFCKFVEMYHRLLKKGTDEVLLDVESNYGGVRGKTMYTLAVSNVLVKPTLDRIVAYFESNGVSIERCHVEKAKQSSVFEDSDQSDYNDVSFLRFVVDLDERNEEFLEDIQASLPQIAKWYDNSVVRTLETVKSYSFAKEKNIKLIDVEVLSGLLQCVHLICSGTEMYEFSKPHIYQVIHRPQAYSIVDVFKKRFDPFHKHDVQDDAAFHKRLAEIKDSYDKYIEVEVERKVLDKMVDLVKATLRTNLYNPDRFAFALKLNPEVCVDPNDELRQTVPYGVFFVYGRRFRGLQLRFREVARGGLRLVTPNSPQAFTIESTRQYGECYDLAFAQQQKNKDIAEGGSKAVCLINSHDDEIDRKHLLRKSVKAFVNSLLDLITIHDTNKEEELIFLGPDEQIGIEHINWIVRRAAERGYRMPTAFMSSKPDQGINHKEFGVTSEGVAVFLDTALKSLNMLDKDYFTVKITGGPDGDVAGNMLKILYREYGEKCRVVGIADGTGCVEDQENGIAWPELLRLFEESKPLDQIDRSKLSSTTIVHDLEKAEGVRMRNTMHNRIVADAFVPGGGRPQTINKTNWKQFLHEVDGKQVPTSRLIVEGANLFLTNEARAELSKLGCVVVKDSSANKCGVICSAFEIISCMLLDKAEFLAIKSELVPQVVKKLQHIARREAELLMTEYRQNVSEDGKVAPDFNLVNTSIEISHAINRTTDGIRERLKEMVANDKSVLDQYKPLVKAFLPDALVTAGYSKFDAKVPEIYVINLVSTILACELVYNEGIDFVKAIKDDTVLTDTAFKYIAEKGLVSNFVSAIENSNLSQDEVKVISKLLQLGGPRAALLAGGIDKL